MLVEMLVFNEKVFHFWFTENELLSFFPPKAVCSGDDFNDLILDSAAYHDNSLHNTNLVEDIRLDV